MPPTEVSLPTAPRVTINHKSYPHIIDRIIQNLDFTTLWTVWRATSRENRDALEQQLFYCYPPSKTRLGGRDGSAFPTPGAATWKSWRMNGQELAALEVVKATLSRCLAHTRVFIWRGQLVDNLDIMFESLLERLPGMASFVQGAIEEIEDFKSEGLVWTFKSSGLVIAALQAHNAVKIIQTDGGQKRIIVRCPIPAETVVDFICLKRCSHSDSNYHSCTPFRLVPTWFTSWASRLAINISYDPEDPLAHCAYWHKDLYHSLRRPAVQHIVALILPTATSDHSTCDSWRQQEDNGTDAVSDGNAPYNIAGVVLPIIQASCPLLFTGGTVTIVATAATLQKLAPAITTPATNHETEDPVSCIDDSKIAELFPKHSPDKNHNDIQAARARLRFVHPTQYRDELGEETARYYWTYRPEAYGPKWIA